MTLRALLHLLLHAAVPVLVAWLFYRDQNGVRFTYPNARGPQYAGLSLSR